MKSLAAIVLTAAVVLGNPARADTISVTYDNPVWNPLSYDSLRFSTNSGGSFSSAVGASRYQATVTGNTGAVDPFALVNNTSDLYIYCYDLFQYITHGQSLTYTVDYSGVQARTLDFLGAVDYALNGNSNVWADPFAWLHPAAITLDGHSLTATNIAVGIQLGIWESLYDTSGTWSLTGGIFQAADVDTGSQQAFDAFVGRLGPANSVAQNQTILLRSDTAQDQITGYRGVSRQTVPEPGSLALLAIAMVGGLAARRRVRKD